MGRAIFSLALEQVDAWFGARSREWRERKLL